MASAQKDRLAWANEHLLGVCMGTGWEERNGRIVSALDKKDHSPADPVQAISTCQP